MKSAGRHPRVPKAGCFEGTRQRGGRVGCQNMCARARILENLSQNLPNNREIKKTFKFCGKKEVKNHMKDKLTSTQQVKKILEEAKEKGLNTDYFFKTTLNRYKTQLKLLRGLEKAIKENGSLVTKEYVKGRENLVANPAIAEYNKTASAANSTVTTLISILKTLPDMDKIESEDNDNSFGGLI